MSEKPKRELYIGIDLGTSNTEITVFLDGKAQTLPIRQSMSTDGLRTRLSPQLPSLVYFSHDGTPMYGEIFRRPHQDISNYSGRVVYNTKRMLMDRPESQVYRFPKRGGGIVGPYSAQDIVQFLLKRCQEEAVEQMGYTAADRVMITIPCCYQMDQIHATIRAARKAGFHIPEDVELITEPVAALVEYIEQQNEKYLDGDPRHIDFAQPQNILVYDLGGGTLDLAVVRIEKIDGAFHFTELANNDGERDRTIGGSNFDTVVANKLTDYLLENAAAVRGCSVQEIIDRLGNTTYMDEAGLLDNMYRFAYQLKHELGRRQYMELNPIQFYDEDSLDVEYVPTYITLDGRIIMDRRSLSYLDMVRSYMTEGSIQNILDPIPNVLKNAMLDGRPLHASEVTKVLITGGMCKFTPVRDCLLNYLDKLANHPNRPIRLTVLESDTGLEAVSIGAALSHKLKIVSHRDFRSKHYLLDVAEGLPRDLTSPTQPPIFLQRPDEAILAVYCGSGVADPGLRRQYYYHARFNPPLEIPARIHFELKSTRSGESQLIGTIPQPGKEDRVIVFQEDTSPQPEQNQPAAAASNAAASSVQDQDDPFDGLIIDSRDDAPQRNIVYQGQSVHKAPIGTDPQPFISSSSNHDDSVSDSFMKIMQVLDIDHRLGKNTPYANMAIQDRFDELLDMLEDYYDSDQDERLIPMFQFALYAMRQFPLDKITPPMFPVDKRDYHTVRDEKLKLIAEGIQEFCCIMGDIYGDEACPRRAQLERELNHCIDEWSWLNLFRLCVSIAQAAGSISLAQRLQERLLRRRQNQRRGRPDAMVKPSSEMLPRLAQIYWNAVDDGVKLNEEQLNSLSQLFGGDCCPRKVAWFASRSFERHFTQLEPAAQKYLRNRHPAIPRFSKTLTLEEVRSPGDLENEAFDKAYDPKNTQLRPNYWKKVNEFLDDEKTAWDMIRVLSKKIRQRSFDKSTKEKLLTMKPGSTRQQQSLAYALSACQTRDASNAVAELWNSCTLGQMASLLQPGTNRDQLLELYLSSWRTWVKTPGNIHAMVQDNSFGLLASMCLCARGPELSRCLCLMTCAIAAIPSNWIGDTVNGGCWKAICDAVGTIWRSIPNADQKVFRKNLTNSLYYLIHRACEYPNWMKEFDQALRNFSCLFQSDYRLLNLYHCDLGDHLLRLFAISIQNGQGCPLSNHCQKQYLNFLNKKCDSYDLRNVADVYQKLLILWYRHAQPDIKKTLKKSDAFRTLVNTVPTDTELDLNAIIHKRS